MPDYAACSADLCPKAKKCARFLMLVQHPDAQTFLMPATLPCAEFWPVTGRVPFRTRDPEVP